MARSEISEGCSRYSPWLGVSCVFCFPSVFTFLPSGGAITLTLQMMKLTFPGVDCFAPSPTIAMEAETYLRPFFSNSRSSVSPVVSLSLPRQGEAGQQASVTNLFDPNIDLCLLLFLSPLASYHLVPESRPFWLPGWTLLCCYASELGTWTLVYTI